MDGKKFLAVLICIPLILGITSFFYKPLEVYAAFNIHEQESKKANIKARKSSLEQTLKETNEKISNKRQQCDNVNKQILSTKSQIKDINDNIAKLDKEITIKSSEITNKQKDIDKNTDILMKRLVAVYKAGEVHAIDLILNAKSFDDFIDKAEIINRIGEHDNKLINSLKNDITCIEKEKNNIENKKATVEADKVSLSQKENDLQNLFSENEKLLKDLEGEQAVAQAEIDENNAEYQKIQNEIMRYYEDEARRKAEQLRLEQLRKKEDLAQKLKAKSTVQLSNQNISTSENKIIISPGNKFAWPVPGYTRLSSQYWEKRGNVYHKGIDIAAPGIYGQPVVAADDGFVFATYAGCTHDYGKLHSCGCGGGYGNYVILAHGNGKISIYGHLAHVSVHEGQTVLKGEKIGAVGSTGHSTGPHLHFQTKHNGIDYNPMDEY